MKNEWDERYWNTNDYEIWTGKGTTYARKGQPVYSKYRINWFRVIVTSIPLVLVVGALLYSVIAGDTK